MKRILLFVLLTMVLGLFGCAHTIGRVEQRWGPPARAEQQDDYTIYYYSFNKASRRGSGVLNVTLTCDNAGNILSKSETWEPSESVAPLPSPYMKKKVAMVQALHEEVEASADPPDMKKEVATVQPLHEELQVSADPPETDPDVTLDVGVEGPPEGNGVYYDGPFDIDGISLYYYGGGFYYVAPGDPHRLLFHHRCPPSRLEYYRNHWRSGWHGFHDRWVQSHKQPWRNDPKREIHRDAPVNKAYTPPSRTYTSSKPSTPPPKTYASSKPSTPPKNTYTPPSKTYTPPQKASTPPAYTPPPRPYTPPPAYTPPPRTYTPPPKHWNPMTKRWE
ncbi:MAG TPA: hypothetical protein VK568_00645 [Thermodesulfobacteriota bacterium]|nr:hypothetical protein [Thermodesulfobacteriota bacterium]